MGWVKILRRRILVGHAQDQLHNLLLRGWPPVPGSSCRVVPLLGDQEVFKNPRR